MLVRNDKLSTQDEGLCDDNQRFALPSSSLKQRVMSAPDISIEELASCLTTGQRLVGLDLGSKTIGIAVSDVMRSIATPWETWKRVKFTQDAEHLLAIAASEDVGGFVLGLPINMDGSEGPRAQSTRAFARNLRGKTDIPIAYWDERLSTLRR